MSAQRPIRLLSVALADVAILAVFAVMAWAAWMFGARRGVPVPLRAAMTAAVFLLGGGGYLSNALPWWRQRFR